MWKSDDDITGDGRASHEYHPCSVILSIGHPAAHRASSSYAEELYQRLFTSPKKRRRLTGSRNERCRTLRSKDSRHQPMMNLEISVAIRKPGLGSIRAPAANYAILLVSASAGPACDPQVSQPPSQSSWHPQPVPSIPSSRWRN